MLGSVESSKNWWWYAAGKHPSANDYIRVGHLSPFADGFTDWVRNGYLFLKPKEKRSASDFCSWRFWARGFGKEALACGLVKDSSDALGRQYPFLVLGNGSLAGWESRWDLLPLACDNTWKRMESLSLPMPKGFGRLEEEILHGLRPPLPQWFNHAARRESLKEDGESDTDRSNSRDMEFTDQSGRTEVLIDLDHGPAGDTSKSAAHWNCFLRDHLPSVPSALFLGGSHEKAYLAYFLRPLSNSDFVRLWSVSRDGKQAGKTATTT